MHTPRNISYVRINKNIRQLLVKNKRKYFTREQLTYQYFLVVFKAMKHIFNRARNMHMVLSCNQRNPNKFLEYEDIILLTAVSRHMVRQRTNFERKKE